MIFAALIGLICERQYMRGWLYRGFTSVLCYPNPQENINVIDGLSQMSKDRVHNNNKVTTSPTCIHIRGSVILCRSSFLPNSRSDAYCDAPEHATIEIPLPFVNRCGNRIPLLRNQNPVHLTQRQAGTQHELSRSDTHGRDHLHVTLSLADADADVEASEIPFVWCLAKVSSTVDSHASVTSSTLSSTQVLSKTFLVPTSNLTSIGGAMKRVGRQDSGRCIDMISETVAGHHVSTIATLDMTDLMHQARQRSIADTFPSESTATQMRWRVSLYVFVPTATVIDEMVSTVSTPTQHKLERPLQTMLESLAVRWSQGESLPHLLADGVALAGGGGGGDDAVTKLLSSHADSRFRDAVSVAARRVDINSRRRRDGGTPLSHLPIKRTRGDGLDDIVSGLRPKAASVSVSHLQEWDLTDVARLHVMFEYNCVYLR
jgi:hypothetical protein